MDNHCFQIHRLFNSVHRYRFPLEKGIYPKNGIYILFEEGEKSHGLDRIVRVGTHTGNDQLPSRLKQHFVNENKDRSIFRKNIGRAILNKNQDSFLEQWEWDLTTRKAKEVLLHKLDIDKQKLIEKSVSEYIQHNFSFVVFPIDDKARRLHLEQRIISTLSWCKDCQPSRTWLGSYSPKKKIQDSGLWLVNGLYKEGINQSEFDEIKSLFYT